MREFRRGAGLGAAHPGGQDRRGGDPPPAGNGHAELSDLTDVFRATWWPAAATLTRILGDLELAEDALQDACVAAIVTWTEQGIPANPLAWLVATARHKALDWQRRESRRFAKEPAYDAMAPEQPVQTDQLGLIIMCCHPALDPGVRVALTLRAVCGLSTGQLAAAFLTTEPTMAQRLVRGKRKIRKAGIRFGGSLGDRLPSVLRTVYLIYTAGHRDAGVDLCAEVEPTAVVAANQAVAVSMVDGPAAGLAMLEELLADEPKLARWAPLHVGRADFLRRLGRTAEADAAVRAALANSPSPSERAHLEGLLNR